MIRKHKFEWLIVLSLYFDTFLVINAGPMYFLATNGGRLPISDQNSIQVGSQFDKTQNHYSPFMHDFTSSTGQIELVSELEIQQAIQQIQEIIENIGMNDFQFCIQAGTTNQICRISCSTNSKCTCKAYKKELPKNVPNTISSIERLLHLEVSTVNRNLESKSRVLNSVIYNQPSRKEKK